ncbi:MAG: hypothetical protein R2797_02845 [Gelidibacter sp.]
MKHNSTITRADFMDFFRDDAQLNTLTVDDRIEIFQTILVGSSDITPTLLQDLLTDYSVTNVSIQ